MSLRILFIGGTGLISSASSTLALSRGHEVTLLNRGSTPVPAELAGAEQLTGDTDDAASLRAAVGSREFDVVANFRAYRPEQVAADIELFGGRTGQ